MRKYKWTAVVNIEVDESWVADGFDLTDERLQELIDEHLLPWSYGHEREVRVRITHKPTERNMELAGT